MKGKYFYVYIASNNRRTVLYIGITNNLERRFLEHEFKKDHESFTAKYNVSELVYFEEYDNPKDAISREKQLKGWIRKRKIELIVTLNPSFKDLSRLS